MRWVLAVWVAVIVVLLWFARPQVEPLTLTDSGHWSPAATLDTGQVEAPPPAPPHGCVAVDAMTLPDEAVGDLLTIGWFSDPTDGGEWLYSPECG